MEKDENATNVKDPGNEAGALRLENCRKPGHGDELSDVERAQLEAAGERYDGDALPAEARLSPPGGDWDEEASFHGFVSVWDLVDDTGSVRYTAWFYRVDSGTIFRAGTTEVVAEVIQCGLESEDETLAADVLEAVRASRIHDASAAHDITIALGLGE
jgi:hypothetical protein